MSKKKPKSDSSKPKKKTTPKKSCGKKCGKNNCLSKDEAQKICNSKLPTLKSEEIILQPESKANYLLGLIKKAFGYGSDT